MTTKEFCNKYNLHDSLLQKIELNHTKKTAKLTIDFCYWQQKGYRDEEPETGTVFIVCSGITSISFGDHQIHDDQIVSCTTNTNGTITMITESDITKDYHTITISAENVEIFRCDQPC